MHLQENTIFDLLPWGQGHTRCSPYPLHYMTYAPEKFDVVKSNGLGGDAFTRK